MEKQIDRIETGQIGFNRKIILAQRIHSDISQNEKRANGLQ
jgi:hypothetical protein